MVQVLVLDEVTFLLLQWEPGAIDKPLAPHDWDVVLCGCGARPSSDDSHRTTNLKVAATRQDVRQRADKGRGEGGRELVNMM
ncbi:hypothetical protein EYF80_035145 [Liparis tanakae]|uniref:Uncharacterized protein n=1 Tax=Liparis tanakae TaxID=230148 RepID=A0A4Z2GPC0_9TELE|nr:hypothetical protein EYF80_035145 [Liparis tanakae]